MLGFSFSPTQKIPGFYLHNSTPEMVLYPIMGWRGGRTLSQFVYVTGITLFLRRLQPLNDQHGISVRVKLVLFQYGLFV